MENRIKFKMQNSTETVENNGSLDLLNELSKYSNNISSNVVDNSLTEYDLYLLPEVDISKFKSFIKQKELFHSFF